METSVLLEFTNKTFIHVKIEDKRITSASFISKNSPENDLQISKEVQKKLGWLIMRGSSGLKEASKYVKLTCNNTKLELQNELFLKGGGGGNSKKRNTMRAPTIISAINPQIQAEFNMIKQQANNTVLEIRKDNEYSISIHQQMKNIVYFIEKYTPTFALSPITYRLLLSEVFRIHLKFSFVSSIEQNYTSEFKIKQYYEEMNSFSQEIRISENQFPTLDIFFFANLMTQHYKYKDPAVKLNLDKDEQALIIAKQFFSASYSLAAFGMEMFSFRFGSLQQKFERMLEINDSNTYQKMYKGMINLWLELQDQPNNQPEDQIIFYIEKFLNNQTDSSIIVYIFMEIYYLLKVLESKDLMKINSENKSINQFVYIIATSSDSNLNLTDSIKRFFSLMNNSSLVRYAQTNIVVELYLQIKHQNQTKNQKKLVDILEMTLIRRNLVETVPSIKVVISQNKQICDLLKEKEQTLGEELWNKFRKSYKEYRQMIHELHGNNQQTSEIQTIEKEADIQKSNETEKEITDMNEAHDQFRQSINTNQNSKLQAEATKENLIRYSLSCSASKQYNKSQEYLNIKTNQNHQTVITCLGQGLGDGYKQCYLERLIRNDKKYVIRLSLINQIDSPYFMFGLIKSEHKDNQLLNLSSNVFYHEYKGGKVTKIRKGGNLHSGEKDAKIGEKTLEFRIDIQKRLFRAAQYPKYEKVADLIDDDKNKENNLENRSYNFAINLYRPGDSVTIQYISEVNSFDDKCE